MSKTIVVNEVQAKALKFLLGGRHQSTLEPAQKRALDDVEAQLHEPPVVADEAPAEARTKAGRGGK